MFILYVRGEWVAECVHLATLLRFARRHYSRKSPKEVIVGNGARFLTWDPRGKEWF